jgi:hypothetical protein
MKTTLVTFANHDSARYTKNLNRLKEECLEFGVPLLYFTDYKELNCPTHQALNYGFKTYAIQRALDLGYTKIVWIDSAVYPIVPIDAFIQHVENNALTFFDNHGLPLGAWCSDACLSYFNINREDAFNIQQTMGCLFGLNFEREEAHAFFNEYQHACLLPTIANGSWIYSNPNLSGDIRIKGHRHDQSIASCILHKMNYNYLNPMQTFLAYKEWYNRFEISKTVCFNSQSY